MADALDLQDIQGLIIRGYGNLRATCYILLEISGPRPAKIWLNALTNAITGSRHFFLLESPLRRQSAQGQDSVVMEPCCLRTEEAAF